MILCDVFIAVNILIYLFLEPWWFVQSALGTNYGDNSQEAILQANRQAGVCFASFNLVIGISLLYLIYRFCINFILFSRKVDEKERQNIKKTNFILSIVNLLSLVVLALLPWLLSVNLSLVSLVSKDALTFFAFDVLPLSVPFGFGVYYLLSSDFWRKAEKV